jgi:hypothetical protein
VCPLLCIWGISMGLFSSKKKTTVNTTVTRVIEDAHLPKTPKQAILRGILNEEDVGAHLLEGMVNSLALKADRMYEYAKRSYYYGVPNSSLKSNVQGRDVVRAVLEQEHGQSIELEYFHYAPINSLHLAWQLLVDNHGYDPARNTLGNLSEALGEQVYLQDIVAVYTVDTLNLADTGTLEQWGPPATAGYSPDRPAQGVTSIGQFRTHTPFLVDDLATEDRIDVHYLTESGDSGILQLSQEGYSLDDEYYQVKYRLVDGSAGYWTYRDGTGLHPEIDAIYLTEYEDLGQFFPFIHFFHDSRNLADAGLMYGTPHKTSTKLLNYLSMSYQDVGDAIAANPNIKDVEQAFMFMAVPANTDNSLEQRYLFEYFNLLYHNSASPAELTGERRELFTGYLPRSGQTIHIQDREFQLTLIHSGLGKRRVAGKIGNLGDHTSGLSSKTYQQTYTRKTAEGTIQETRTINLPYHFYRRQVNSIFYDEVVVFDLKLVYHIYGKYNFVGSGSSETLLIPLDRSLTGLFSLPDREALYARSIHHVFNTKVVTVEKWYQSGWFRIVMIIVAVIITIYTLGTAWKSIVAAAAISATAVAIVVLELVLYGLIANYAIKLFVQKLGPKLGAIGAVLAAVAAMAIAAQTGNFGQSVWAQRLLQLSNGLARATDIETQRLLSEFDGERHEFKLFTENANKELEEAQKLLGDRDLVNPFEFIGLQPFTLFGESPSAFYDRTVHSGNIGVVGIEAISSYVDNALQLPTFTNSVGDTLYA